MPTKKTDKKEEENADLKQALGKIAEFEGKFKTMEEEKAALDEYLKGTNLVLNTIASDEALKKTVQAKLEGKKELDKDDGREDLGNKPDPTIAPLVQKIDKMEAGQREKTIKEFESRVGIDKLKPEEQKEARLNIEQHLRLYDSSVGKVPVDRLETVLDSAYKTINVDKQIADGKAEGATQARQNAHGTMSSVSGGAPDTSDEERLTTEQTKWAEKLGVDPEGAAKTFKERDSEQTRLTKSEVKAKEALED